MQRKKRNKRVKPSGVISYTKRYANTGRRKKVAYEHGINREKIC